MVLTKFLKVKVLFSLVINKKKEKERKKYLLHIMYQYWGSFCPHSLLLHVLIQVLLYFQVYLSLPEGTASVVGLIALMTDHYCVLVRLDMNFT